MFNVCITLLIERTEPKKYKVLILSSCFTQIIRESGMYNGPLLVGSPLDQVWSICLHLELLPPAVMPQTKAKVCHMTSGGEAPGAQTIGLNLSQKPSIVISNYVHKFVSVEPNK